MKPILRVIEFTVAFGVGVLVGVSALAYRFGYRPVDFVDEVERLKRGQPIRI